MAQASTNGRGEVLLVSPSRIFARSLGRMVEALGFRVRPGGAEGRPSVAGAAFCLVQEDPALVSVAEDPSVPVIAFSKDARMEQAALASGAWDFLHVPCRAADLERLVEQWLALQAGGRPEPEAPAPAQAPTPMETPTPGADGGATRVLLVDDSQVIHGYVERALAPHGFEVLHANDGREGLEAALRERPDLIISDIDMPEMNGYEMCRAVKEHPETRSIPILILSARGAGVDIDLGFDVGANDFLTKPVSENELLSRVQLVAGRGDGQRATRETVLVVEDSGVQRAVIVQALAQQGFDVHEAENGKVGLDLALQLVPDLIVTDSEMPVMNGRDLTREVKQREKLRDVPVMMLTAADSELSRAKGRHAGVAAYLTKPFVADKVVVIAEKLVGERRLLREREAMQRYLSESAQAAASAAADAKGALDASMRAETRFATVLFSDLVGFTPLTERMEPAELVQLLNGYFDAVVPIVGQGGGIVDKLIGDAVMALFVGGGGEEGHRADATNAVRTGLAMLAALERYNAQSDEPLAMRIGIHSGPMVMGDIGSRSARRDYTALGDNVNIGARLESAAARDTVLISDATYALVRDRFEVEPMGPIAVKGKSEPISVYRPIREREDSPDPETVSA